MKNLMDYAPMMEFLAKVHGPDTEFVLSDREQILHVENAIGENTAPGAPLGEWEKTFLQEKTYHEKPYVVNYRALSTTGERMRSATFFIRDENGKMVGMLSMNSRVEDLLRVRRLVDAMVNGPNPNLNVADAKNKANPIYDNLSISVEELISSVVDERLAACGVPAERLTTEEKKDIVRELEQKGAFMVKGSVPIVARRLASSDATIYRYLHQLNGG